MLSRRFTLIPWPIAQIVKQENEFVWPCSQTRYTLSHGAFVGEFHPFVKGFIESSSKKVAGSVHIHLYGQIKIRSEHLLYDLDAIVSAVGGSLGLFLGLQTL